VGEKKNLSVLALCSI